MTSASVTPTPEAPPLSEGARIVNTFIAPSRTFTDLRRSAAWWAPFLLIVIFSTAFVYVAGQKVGFRKAMENQMQAQPKTQERLEQLPPDQREKQLQQGAKITKDIAYAFPAIQFVILVIIAAALFGTFKFAAGANVSFKVALAIVMYASLPGLLRAVLCCRVFAGGRECGLVYLSESGGYQSWLFPESGGFAVPLQFGLVARHLPDLDAGAHGHRLYLREQGKAGYGAGHCFRLVAGLHTGGRWLRRIVLIATRGCVTCVTRVT